MTATMTMTQKDINSKIQQIGTLIKDGVDAWVKAGEILVELVEEDPHTYDYVIQQFPGLNAQVLGQIEKIGRKILHPQLLLTSAPGFSKLRKLPMSMQERYLEEPVPIIVHTSEGTDVMLVQAKNMTKEQARQVFAPGRVRTEGEQKAWLMQERSLAAKPVVARPWTIKGSKAIINGVEFTRKELAGIVAQMD